MYSAAYVWAKILARLEQQLSEVTVSTWLDDAEIIEKMQREIPEILADKTLWGEDLSDMTEAVTTAKWSRA